MPPPAPDFRARSYRYATFPEFERILLEHALPWFTSAEAYYEAGKVIFAKHVAQNVRYVETSFHLPVTQFIRVPGPEIMAAMLRQRLLELGASSDPQENQR